MKVYVVCFYIDYENIISSKTKAFKEEEAAKEYCNKLNRELAAFKGEKVEDLDEYYYCEEIDLI